MIVKFGRITKLNVKYRSLANDAIISHWYGIKLGSVFIGLCVLKDYHE